MPSNNSILEALMDDNYNTPELILEHQKEIEEKIAYQFNNHTNLLIQAFTRKSYSQEHDDYENNEILEFYGDQLVNTVITKWLFDSYSQLPNSNSFENNQYVSQKDEAALTKIRANYANKSALAHCIDMLDLDQYLLLGKGDEKNEVWNNEKVRCDLFEAIIGAIAVDSLKTDFYHNTTEWDFEQIEKSCKKMWEMLDFSENFIRTLSDLCEEYEINTKYEFQNYYIISGQKRTCILYLYRNDRTVITKVEGSGVSELAAKLDAAKKALRFLETYEVKKYLSTVTIDNSVQALNDLYLKKKISKPDFDPISKQDEDGNQYWRCECFIEDYKDYDGYMQAGIGEANTKAEAKKIAAYDMVKFILNC